MALAGTTALARQSSRPQQNIVAESMIADTIGEMGCAHGPGAGSVALVTACCLLVAGVANADTIVDSRNQSSAPFPAQWSSNTSDVGWTYSPSFSYLLTGIFTEFATFGTGIHQNVTAELYDSDPLGGSASVLASATFTATEGSFVGASIAPIPLTGGHEYFVAFRNVAGLGVDYTTDPSATHERRFGYSAGTGTFANSAAPDDAPILQFQGQIAPLPPIALAGVAILASFAVIRSRARAHAR
jgi:hypothetical protein